MGTSGYRTKEKWGLFQRLTTTSEERKKVECLSSTGKRGVLMLLPHQQSGERVMVGQSHSRANSSTNTGDRKGVDYLFFM